MIRMPLRNGNGDAAQGSVGEGREESRVRAGELSWNQVLVSYEFEPHPRDWKP